MSTIKSILLGACYGFCTILLIKGEFVKPPLLSQVLGIATAALAVRKTAAEMPKLWFALGFIAGGVITWFLKLR